MADDEQAADQVKEKSAFLSPQKIYLKDVSFESPRSPAIFTHDWKNWRFDIELEHNASQLAEETYDVTLKLVVTTTVDTKTIYLAEVQQAGVYTITGLDPDTLNRRLNVFCVAVLYPYACAALNDIVGKGGFTRIPFQHVNFGTFYDDYLQRQAQQKNRGDLKHHLRLVIP